MQYDKELIAHKLDRWDRFITDYHLPEWDSIPDLGLYMDQVVVLLAQYLNFIPAMPGGKESFVTSSTINNYVRLKIMPAPVKRKYFRVHIAYLISIPRNSATLPCFSTSRSRTRRRISARRTSPARPPCPGWSSKAP